MSLQLNFDFLRKIGWQYYPYDSLKHKILNRTNVESANLYLKVDKEYFLICIYKGTKYDKNKEIHFYGIIKKIGDEEIFSEIWSNIDLFRYIIDNKACNKEYARNFDIQKILKNE